MSGLLTGLIRWFLAIMWRPFAPPFDHGEAVYRFRTTRGACCVVLRPLMRRLGAATTQEHLPRHA